MTTSETLYEESQRKPKTSVVQSSGFLRWPASSTAAESARSRTTTAHRALICSDVRSWPGEFQRCCTAIYTHLHTHTHSNVHAAGDGDGDGDDGDIIVCSACGGVHRQRRLAGGRLGPLEHRRLPQPKHGRLPCCGDRQPELERKRRARAAVVGAVCIEFFLFFACLCARSLDARHGTLSVALSIVWTTQ